MLFISLVISQWHFTVLSWFTHDYAVSYWDTVMLIFFSIAVLLVFLISFFLAYNTLGKWKHLIFIIIWISYEILFVEWEIPFPMLSLGSVLGSYPSLIQWYSFTGVFGGTFWILAINFFVLKLMLNGKLLNWKAMTTVVIPIIISLGIYYDYTKEKVETINVIAVNNKLETNNHFNCIIDMLEHENDSAYKLIVCPEGIIKLSDSSIPVNKYFSALKRLLVSKHKQATIIVGCGLKIKRMNSSKNTNHYNLAVQCDTTGFVDFRNKKILVPFGEFIPYPEYLCKIKRIQNAVNEIVDYNPNYDRVLEHDRFRILPLICYELYFSNKIRRYYKSEPPNVICCSANEYAIPNRLYYNQFSRMSTILAVSFKSPVIKSTINGYSSIINCKGKMISSYYNTDEIVKGKIELNSHKTIYAKYGYYPLLGLLIICCIGKSRTNDYD